MSTPKRGLGRGLGSLIPTAPGRSHTLTPPADDASSPGVGSGPAQAPLPGKNSGRDGLTEGRSGWDSPQSLPEPNPGAAAGEVGAYFDELDCASISPNPRQPRSEFDEMAMAELVHSIRQIGLLQPVVVRATGAGAYQLVMGERRWRAVQAAGLATIPAIVRQTPDDDLLRDALLENVHRADLNPLEEAAAYGQLLDDFGCTHDQLAARLGRSRSQVTNTLRLLKLAPGVQRRVASGVLSAGHARTLLAVDSPDQQDALATRVTAEGISVRALEEIVAMGEYGEAPLTRRRSSQVFAPGLSEIAGRLSERFETRCTVTLGRRKGKITVEFASLEDLQRILGLLEKT